MHLRVLTYNIHKCIGGVDRRYDLPRVCSVIAAARPDIVMLQEVDKSASRSDYDHQVASIGEKLGLEHFRWAGNVRLRSGGAYGNAILSRYPIKDWRNIDITVPPKKRRSVLHVATRVRVGGQTRTVHVLNAHLGLANYERRQQLRMIFESLPTTGFHEQSPVLFAGDLNDVWGTVRTSLVDNYQFAAARPINTFPSYAPMRALDGIYVRGQMRIDDVFVPRCQHTKTASDHLPLAADICLTRE